MKQVYQVTLTFSADNADDHIAARELANRLYETIPYTQRMEQKAPLKSVDVIIGGY